MSARPNPRRPASWVTPAAGLPPAQDRRLIWICLGLIVAAGFFAYQGSLRAPFVFDDIPGVVENESIRDLRRLGAVLRPPAGGGMDSRPLVNLSLALNHAAGGLEPFGYHLVNVTLHVLGALTLFGFLRRTLGLPGLPVFLAAAALPVAFCSALLWTVHPLQSETVICVMQRTESLVSLCYLLTLYAFVRGAGPGGTRGWLWLALGACLVGMSAKEVMVSAPLVLVLFDRTFLAGSLREVWRRRGRWHAAFATTWVLLAVLVLDSGGERGGTAGYGQGVTAWTYLLTQARAILIYLKLVVWPHPLIVDYGTWLARDFKEVAPEFLAVATLFGLAALALWRWPRAGFAAACFFLILAPSSSVYPLVSQTIAEHRMHLPLAAVLVLLVVGGVRLAGVRPVLVGCLLLAAGATVLTVRRGADYASEEALWTDLIAKQPDNAWAHFNLAKMHFRRGEAARAEELNREAVRLMPGNPSMQLAWALSLERLGRLELAAAAYRETLRLKPGQPPALFRLGLVLLRQGRTEEAVSCFEAVLRLSPGHADAMGNLGAALMQLGRLAEAVPHLERMMAARPESGDARFNLGQALLRLDRFDEAAGHFATAARLAPEAAEVQTGWGNALAATGRYDEAVAAYDRSLRLNAAQPVVHFNLGHVLLRLNRRAEARGHFAEAWRQDASFDEAREMLERLPAGP